MGEVFNWPILRCKQTSQSGGSLLRPLLTGICSLARSTARTVLTACFEKAREKRNVSPGNRLAILGKWVRYVFSEWKMSSASLLHTKFARLQRTWKKTSHLSTDFNMKRPRAAIHPVKCWTSLMFCGSFMSNNALNLFGFAFIPWLLIHKTQELSRSDTKGTLFRVKFHIVSLKNFK